MNPRFYFATCQIGAEKAVKAEVIAEHPSLRFAFSRPGFITFKQESDSNPPLLLQKSIFTRLWGEVVDQSKDPSALSSLLQKIPSSAVVQYFDRDQQLPGDEPNGFVPHSHIHGIVDGISGLPKSGTPRVGDEVYSLIWVDDFHVFLGRHRHHPRWSGDPGNMPIIPLSEKSPSRAYLKIQEAIHRFQPKIERGMQVLEVGCSPGGATTAMIERGMKVTGVDPKFMDHAIYELPGFLFIQKCARDVKSDDLRSINPDWLVMDMNIAPLEALDELSHVVSLLRANFRKDLKLKQGFFTIKLNDWKFAEKTNLYLKRLEEMGFQGLRPVQLCSNRQEFFVFAEKFRI